MISTPRATTISQPTTVTLNFMGKLLKSDGPAIYRLMEDGTLRHIPTWADFVALGYENDEITTLNDAELAGYPLGPPLTAQTSASAEVQALEPLVAVSDLGLDRANGILWLGTTFAGLFACPWDDEEPPDLAHLPGLVHLSGCHNHTTFTGALLDNTIHALAITDGGTAAVASRSGLSWFDGEMWQATPLAEGATTLGALSVAFADDSANDRSEDSVDNSAIDSANTPTIWVGGDQYIAHGSPNGRWQIYTALEQPLLADSFSMITMTDEGAITFLGEQREVHFDGATWRAYASDGTTAVEFLPDPPPSADVVLPPQTFPNPQTNYQAWLETWPRPTSDNGRCMHFVQTSWLDVDDAQRHIDRLVGLGVRWTVVPYANHFQLRRLAPLFAAADITVIWRPFVRPYEHYDWWVEDVSYLRTQGYPPYLQLYNEPSLAQEWDVPNSDDDPAIDQLLYLAQLAPAVRTVYNAGGYVGLQLLDLEWTRTTLAHLKSNGLEDTFDRLFFVPHPYGLNHPPSYDEDESSVLGFRAFAAVFADEIGFVPMMIAGEGGWRPNEQQDERFPPVSYENHRNYHVEVFEWFRISQLSNGKPLPDYLFAFCPWLIADPVDSAGWYDSQSGDRVPTIEAVQALPPFVRRFSWD